MRKAVDVNIWTKFDKNPITLREIGTQAAEMFEREVSSPEWDYATIDAVDGFHMIKREHILRVHFSNVTTQKEVGGDNGTV